MIVPKDEQHGQTVAHGPLRCFWCNVWTCCAQAPIHDVPTAAEVLETGGYRSMPAAIEDLRPAAVPAPAERAAALRLVDQMLRARLLQVSATLFSAYFVGSRVDCWRQDAGARLRALT